MMELSNLQIFNLMQYKGFKLTTDDGGFLEVENQN